jgi:NAD(P)-dependent dehydrogenase (short-subunit alcohol dehydrogenase family)
MNDASVEYHPLHNKICLVTGGTAGIGKVVAAGLAAQGAEVVITGRNLQKAQAVSEQIQSETGSDRVHALWADFADLGQVRRLAADFKKQYSRLDVLVNNAGAFFNARQKTPYAVEKTFLVNHLAPFLLTNLLLDVLKASAPARIVNVASDAHKSGGIMNLEDLMLKRFYFGMRAYGRSKLANILFTYELSRRLAGSGVTANALHPGHVATNIWRNDFGIFGPALLAFTQRIALTPEQGADKTIFLASSPEVEAVTGKYFVKRQSVASSPQSYDADLARCLWDLSDKLTGLYNSAETPVSTNFR